MFCLCGPDSSRDLTQGELDSACPLRTCHNVLKIHPCCSRCQNFLPFWEWIHPQKALHFIYLFIFGWVPIYYVKHEHCSYTRRYGGRKDLVYYSRKEKSKCKCKYTYKYIMYINTGIEFHKESIRYKFFLCGPFLKMFIEFVTILMLFYILSFFLALRHAKS